MSALAHLDPALRPAGPQDLEAMRRIYVQHVLHGTASFELTPPDAEEFTRRFQAVRAARLPWYVAELDGVVAGYAYASVYRPRPAYRFTVEDSVYVNPRAQRRGLGRALLAATLEAAEGAGMRQMVAVIAGGPDGASVALHENLGFRHVGTLVGVGYKFGRWLNTILMQRELGEGAATCPVEPDGVDGNG